jgi:hypothetical protein
MEHDVRTLPSRYLLLPGAVADCYAIATAEATVVEIHGEWATRMYQLLQGKGDTLNCYQGANVVLNNTATFGGKRGNQMLMKGEEIPYQKALDRFGMPMGVQWGSTNMLDRNPRQFVSHIHSAVVIAGDTEDQAIAFEIPGYAFAARITTLKEVQERIASSRADFLVLHQHFHGKEND